MAGLIGVCIGAWLTGRRERRAHLLSFYETQLKQFYSPMLGLRNEIKMCEDLQKRIHSISNTTWKELYEKAQESGPEAVKKLSNDRRPYFDKIDIYDANKLDKEVFPFYQRIVKLFRDYYWLADLDTRQHYQCLIEFVEIWRRWFDSSIPSEILKNLDFSEMKLMPFYDHIQNKHDILRSKIKKGKV